MPREPVLPVRLDLQNAWVWQGEQRLTLTPKAFAVLRYLLEHAGRVVTKEELLQTVWMGTVVSEGALTTCMREIRKGLGEGAQAPHYIETVHRRGYRWLAPLPTAAQTIQKAKRQVHRRPSTPRVVGREAEFEHLQRWLEQARGGERQIVFVMGEAGIGKTTLVDAWLERVGTEEEIWRARGQCIEHYGSGEAYLPVLEALGRLCRQPVQERLIGLLRQYAPTWLVQLPWLLSPAEREALQREVLGTTRERMLREIAEALEAVTAETPLVLVLEDLHWSDAATLDLLASLARRREAARLLLIGTYRPVEVIVREHPLRGLTQELQLHGHCTELPLEGLTEAAIAAYLAGRFPGSMLPPELARVLLQRTEGNPLFMVNVVEYLVAQGVLVQGTGGWELTGGVEAVERGMPESLRQMIERHIAQLSPEDQGVLEVASVMGVEFSAAAVAAGLAAEEQVEERCTALARRQHFLYSRGTSEWPDGTVTARYSFLHALYPAVWRERVTEGRRIQLHRRIGARLEAGYGTQAGEIAVELAVHFEAGRDYQRAVRYRGQAAERVLWRCAYQEAISHLTRGLELLKTLPDTLERAQHELLLQALLGPALIATKGHGAPEVEQAYLRARELCRQVGETPQLFSVLYGLSRFHLLRAELHTARELGEQCLTLAQSLQEPAFLVGVHQALGNTLFHLGELDSSQAQLAQGIALYHSQQHRVRAFFYEVDPGVVCHAFAAWTLWHLGYPGQALQRSAEALTLACELSHPFTLAITLALTAHVQQCCQEGQLVQEQAEAALALSTAQGFVLIAALSTMLRGWALAAQGRGEAGMAQLHQGLAAWHDLRTELMRPYYLALLAEAHGRAGQTEAGLRVIAEALMIGNKNGERCYEAELYRLKGELLLHSRVQSRASRVRKKSRASRGQHREAEAEECFLQAITIARRQRAKSLELRAAMSLSRLWQRQGKRAEARQLLVEVYGWFTEGFDTADLQEAKALLEALA